MIAAIGMGMMINKVLIRSFLYGVVDNLEVKLSHEIAMQNIT